MRRPLSLLCLGALAASGLAVSSPATAAPAERASTTAAAAVPDELLVGYVEGASPAERQRARGRAGAAKQEQVVRGEHGRSEVELVRLPAGKDRDRAIAELEVDPAVAYAEPNWIYTHQAKPNAKPGGGGGSAADYFADGRLWGMYGDASSPANPFGSGAAEAWGAGNTGSAAVHVGVIDEGIQVDHPDLKPNVWKNPIDSTFDGLDQDSNGYVDDVNGWDFAGNDSSVYDGGSRGATDDHGTHVAGTIGAVDGVEKGVIGVTKNVTMISGKFLGRNGGTTANAVKAVDYFTGLKKRGVNVVATNNSWGGGGFSQGLFDAISRANAADILFIAAAGNDGSNNDTTTAYPSGYELDNVISVAAITKTGTLASFSNYGLTSVDLGAPGDDIWSTTAYNGYSSYRGTSMATPHVTGAAALYAAAYPGSSAATIKAALLDNAIKTSSLEGRTGTGGRLDVDGAIPPPTAP